MALCISSLASTLSVSSSVCGLRRAPVDEALQLTAGGELGGDALEDTVADERARELLRQRSGERPVDDPRDLGRGQDLVDGFLDRPTPGPCGRAGREEGGAPGRVCQAGLALVVLRCLHAAVALGVSATHAPTLDYQPVARQHPSPPAAGRRLPRRRTCAAAGAVAASPRGCRARLAAPRIGPSGYLEVGGVEDERPRLEAAHAAVEGDQLLEGAAFVEVGVVEAADHDVADVLEAVGAQQVLRRVGREMGERVVAVDAALREVVGAVGAERDGAVLGGADEQPADVRVAAERRDQLGVTLVDLLERQSAALLHQVDEPEVAGAEHDDVAVGDVVLRLASASSRSPR